MVFEKIREIIAEAKLCKILLIKNLLSQFFLDADIEVFYLFTKT